VDLVASDDPAVSVDRLPTVVRAVLRPTVVPADLHLTVVRADLRREDSAEATRLPADRAALPAALGR
jgi:hypothetical protein